MADLDSEKVARFKARIGFAPRSRGFAAEAAPSTPVEWPDPLEAPGLADGSWRLVADTPWRDAAGNAREWVLRRGPETVVVLAFVSAAGEEGARNFFLARACDTMTLDVPYVAGPAELGSLAVQSPHPEAPYLLWVFANKCVELKGMDTRIDLLPVARWLQGHLETAPRSRGAAPRGPAAQVSLSALRAQVGEPITLQLMPGPSSSAAGYLMELEYDPLSIEVLAQDGLDARLCGLRPGPAPLTVHAVDVATLESSAHDFTLTFLTPGAR